MIPNNYPMAALNLICFALIFTSLTQAKIKPENIVGIWLFNQGAVRWLRTLLTMELMANSKEA